MKVARRIAVVLLTLAAVLVLVGAVLLFTGRAHYKIYIVESNSMGEAMPAGSIIVVDTESDIQEGDIISFHVGPQEITTHRLIAINDDGTIVTKGDAVEQVDPFVATTDDIIGEVVAVFPNLGKVVTFLSTPAGFASIALLVIGGGILIAVLTDRDDDEGVEPTPEDDEDPHRG
jgi:signal peptidase I